MKSGATHLLNYLTYSAQAGGYFFIGLALLGLSLLLLISLDVLEISAAASPHFVSQWLIFCAGLTAVGLWLLDYKRRLRQALADRKTFCRARLLERHGPTEFGWFIKVEVELSPTQLCQGQQRFLAEPCWQVGDTLVVCVLADGHRFFPKELTQRADVGYLQK